jgi:hypothetical protein
MKLSGWLTSAERELNLEGVRIYGLGVDHSVGIHGFSMPCPMECPRREISQGEARDRARALFRERATPPPRGE